MKVRKSIILCATILALGSTTLSAFAASPNRPNTNNGQKVRLSTNNTTASSNPYFIDEDGDGICDNYATGRGANWVDEDENGICDNYKNGTCPGGRGQGKGMGRGQGRGYFLSNTL